MKEKKQNPTKFEEQSRPLSLMAVQEKLGLFRIRKKAQEGTEEEHDYLKKKPLGLI